MSDADARDPLEHFVNVLSRPPGPWLRALGLALPGVRAVAAQTEPYAAYWRAANAAALRQDGPVWVALGDSMSQGIGASAPQNGWVGQTAAALEQAGRRHRVVNLSMTGARVDDVIGLQLPALRSLPRPPELVTVLAGANDMVSPRRRRDLVEAFDRLIGLLPDDAVVAYQTQPTEVARQVNEAIDAAAARRGFVAVGVQGSWRGRLARDFFHPNDAGYALIADAFTAAILGVRQGTMTTLP